MIRRSIPFLLAAATALTGCGGSGEKPGSSCPVVGNRGPGLAADSTYLLIANSLGEDWQAAPLGRAHPAALPAHGLTGQAPNDLEVVGDRLYVLNSGDNSLTEVELATGETARCLDLGTGVSPWALAVDPTDSTRAWITTFSSGELLEVDLAAFHVTRRILVGTAAEGLWVGADRIAVTLTGYDGAAGSYGNGTVVMLDRPTLAVDARIPVPPNPQFVLRGADGSLQVICTGDYGAVSGLVVRLASSEASARDTLALGGTPYRATLAPGGTVFVAAFFGGILSYDSGSFTPVHDSGNPVRAEAGYSDVLAAGGRLYAANFDRDAVLVLDSAGAATDTILAGDGPSALALRPAGR